MLIDESAVGDEQKESFHQSYVPEQKIRLKSAAQSPSSA